MTDIVLRYSDDAPGAPASLRPGEPAARSIPASGVVEMWLGDAEGVPREMTTKAQLDSAVSFTPDVPGTPELLTVVSEVQRGTARPEWFQTAGAGSDYFDALTDLVGALGANPQQGGRVLFSRGAYNVDGEVVVDVPGIVLEGEGVGNNANSPPFISGQTPTLIVGTATTGAIFRFTKPGCGAKMMRVTSDATREAEVFDLDKPGLRFEPADVEFARADRCILDNVRVDLQPGDGILTVGNVTYMDARHVDTNNNKGFGVRMDAGNWPGLVRTWAHYPGLFTWYKFRAFSNGGHAFAASNPDAQLQNEMAIRGDIFDADTFNNGSDTSIMYGNGVLNFTGGDGNFADVWIFGENCRIVKSGLGGIQGPSFTPEGLCGVFIAGRDNEIINSRFINTKQPVFWGNNNTQPSSGLIVHDFRMVTTALTHDYVVKPAVPSNTRGASVRAARREGFIWGINPRVPGAVSEIEGRYELMSGTLRSHEEAVLTDGQVLQIDFVLDAPTTFASGILSIAGNSSFTGAHVSHFRVGSSSEYVGELSPDPNGFIVVGPNGGNGVLDGTNGTAGKINLSCSGTTYYVANQLGRNATVTLLFSALSNLARIDSFTVV